MLGIHRLECFASMIFHLCTAAGSYIACLRGFQWFLEDICRSGWFGPKFCHLYTIRKSFHRIFCYWGRCISVGFYPKIDHFGRMAEASKHSRSNNIQYCRYIVHRLSSRLCFQYIHRFSSNIVHSTCSLHHIHTFSLMPPIFVRWCTQYTWNRWS